MFTHLFKSVFEAAGTPAFVREGLATAVAEAIIKGMASRDEEVVIHAHETRDPRRKLLLARLIEILRQRSQSLQINIKTSQWNARMKDYIPQHIYLNYIQTSGSELIKKIKEHRFWYVSITSSQKDPIILYDSITGLLWQHEYCPINAEILRDNQELIKDITINSSLGGIKSWRLPSEGELNLFIESRKNQSLNRKNKSIGTFLTDSGKCCVEGYIDGDFVTCVNDHLVNKQSSYFVFGAIEHEWNIWANNNTEEYFLLKALMVTDLKEVYRHIDNVSSRLPVLKDAQFTDPGEGLWEFWGMPDPFLSENKVRARNPAVDVQNDCDVAIDFGTSSTVVAYQENGNPKLLRIGVRDFYEKVIPEHYENPTLLEFVDFQAIFNEWQRQAYRPGVRWDDVRCSHEALHNFRHNETNPKIVASVLTKIKQWALREGNNGHTRITDQENSFEHELSPLTKRQPVKDQPLEVRNEDAFDPVELYAYLLGLTINWRGRGIFLRYFMTFPVEYPKEVKENILASFRRGLQRSLPEKLICQPEFQEFSVEEKASEPAAYAAAALPTLRIAPTSNGVAYGVFDFGGGTSDFDFGYYRLPTPEEESEADWEEVFEHFGAAGDKYLGGENLLEDMAYQVFRHNIEICRDKKIAFTRPLDADDFPGSELFLERTQSAATNTVMLISRLRPLWETGKNSNTSGVEKIAFLNREGQKVDCEFLIPDEDLASRLELRIERGIKNFFAALQKAFIDKPPEEIHILLAGNASRSQLVTGFFGLLENNEQAEKLYERTMAYLRELFSGSPPLLTVHPPLPIDESDPYKPTGKTGVAIGLLRLCPGGVVKVINHSAEKAAGEAPFAYYVGRVMKGKFLTRLTQGATYKKWFELGTPHERVFKLYHTQSPLAHTGEMQEGDGGIFMKRLKLAGENVGHKIFVRAVGPSRIEICTATSIEAANGKDAENLKEYDLK